ncbi:uncharacterized protein MYCFIDRAFT_172555 [Pseudocercospora fijiensis CIRAD86]|uniref:Uncharacterized protein n=1 Tax=Pseudocercospora fijiensis (strain CIRAD86) TaxID=383855 RepID=M3BC58_PSEFD|nr:uncharacterized protein MYCFIDRAFT_172555 [Pseudocercospora fijiensis CIRAD86]EME86867.1 hypothetical protein MYCFIDRAFT_172555 [Pseudocercospora fijiensis CIRAD86]
MCALQLEMFTSLGPEIFGFLHVPCQSTVSQALKLLPKGWLGGTCNDFAKLETELAGVIPRSIAGYPDQNKTKLAAQLSSASAQQNFTSGCRLRGAVPWRVRLMLMRMRMRMLPWMPFSLKRRQ